MSSQALNVLLVEDDAKIARLTRVLAAEYGVSRNTAVAAYDLLLSEGYLTSRRGAGTYVADVLPKPSPRVFEYMSMRPSYLAARWP